MRNKIVAGNWKMHKTAVETKQLLNELIDKLPNDVEAQIIVAPTFVNLSLAINVLENSNIAVAAQNMHQAEAGAFTGEISASMLTNIGVQTVILGHSERRAYFHETDALLAEKVNTALKHDMTVIFCFGEELKDRQDNQHFNVVENQLRDGLFHIENNAWEKIILAYEPVWAIGTGKNAAVKDAENAIAFIRACIGTMFSESAAKQIQILYGGSVKTDNAKSYLNSNQIDGALIGGASLDAINYHQLLNV